MVGEDAGLPTAPRFAAFLSRSAAAFDSQAFKISGPDASVLDPQARLLLEESYGAPKVADGRDHRSQA